jgi:hypothetical protein
MLNLYVSKNNVIIFGMQFNIFWINKGWSNAMNILIDTAPAIK